MVVGYLGYDVSFTLPKSHSLPPAFADSDIPATRFWTVNCVKAGWMTKSKGTWQLTDAGREAYARFPDPGDFIRESSRLYSEWRAARPEKVAESQPSGTSDEEAIEEREAASTTLEEATERAWLQVQDYLMAMDAYDFQDLVVAERAGLEERVMGQG